MKKHLEKLLAQRTAKQEDMQALLDTAKREERSLTKDEGLKYDEYERDFTALSADIKRTESQIERETELDKPQREALGAEQRENPSDVPVDIKRYSLMRAVAAQVSGDWDNAEYERECSLKIADNLGREAKGIFVPYDVQRAVMATQAGAGFTDAGALVSTDHMDNMFIDSLQADSFVVANGGQVLTGLVGDIDIPRSLGGVSFTWVDEDGNSIDSNMNLDSIRMSPKTITGSVPISRRLLKQSSPAVEALIQNDIRRGVALAIDTAVIAGTGTLGQPKGILNTTGVSTQPVASAAAGTGVPTFAETVGFETTLAGDNALAGRLVYATTPTINGLAKTTAIDAGSGIMLNKDNMMNGYPVIGTTLMPAKKVLFGNFTDIIIGMWGVMDIVVDTAAKAASGGIVVRVFQDIDVAVRHPQSFCVTA